MIFNLPVKYYLLFSIAFLILQSEKVICQNNWVRLSSPDDKLVITDFITDYNNNYYCTAGEYSSNRVYVSIDEGKSWYSTQLDSITNGNLLLLNNGSVICADKNSDYVPARKGFSISTNFGTTWNSFNDGIPLVDSWQPGKLVNPVPGPFGLDLNGNVVTLMNDKNTGFTDVYQYNFTNKKWEPKYKNVGDATKPFIIIDDNTFLFCDGNALKIESNGNINILQSHGLNLTNLYSFDYDRHSKISYISNNIGISWVVRVPILFNSQVYTAHYPEQIYNLSVQFDSTKINDTKIDKIGNVYLATTKGVFSSRNNGTNWYQLNDELKNLTVFSIEIGLDNSIFAITGNGLYKLKNYDTVKVINPIPAEFKLSQNYPNPFNPNTTINYSIPEVSFPSGEGNGRGVLVTLKVYDMLGREVATLVNEYKQPGDYQVKFNARHLERSREMPSGVYFYRLHSGSFCQTKKLILMK